MRRTLIEAPLEKDKRARQGERHFRVRRQLLNWNPEGLVQALALISISIQDVRVLLLALNGAGASELEFQMLPEEAFCGPLGKVGGMSYTNIDLPVIKGDVKLFEAEELKRDIADGMRQIRERRG